MPNGGPTHAGLDKSKMKSKMKGATTTRKMEGATTQKIFYEYKRWNTSCMDDGWHGALVGIEWNGPDGHVGEKWKWTPPPAPRRKRKADDDDEAIKGKDKDKDKDKGKGNGKNKNKGKAKAKAKGKGRGNS